MMKDLNLTDGGVSDPVEESELGVVSSGTLKLIVAIFTCQALTEEVY